MESQISPDPGITAPADPADEAAFHRRVVAILVEIALNNPPSADEQGEAVPA